MTSGIVIGSFMQPSCVRLNIRAIRHTCGDVPILIHDDGSPARTHWQLCRIAAREGVHICQPVCRRVGHAGGDIAALAAGLAWAASLGIDYLCKLSQRFIIHGIPNWLQDVAVRLSASGAPIACRRPCGEGVARFPLRSEFYLVDVKMWAADAILDDLRPVPIHEAAEGYIWRLVQKHFKGHSTNIGIVGTSRNSPVYGVLWHCHSSRAEYVEVAKRLGVNLGKDFFCYSWRHRLGKDYRHG